MEITESKIKEILTEQREAFQEHVDAQFDRRITESERRTDARMDKWFTDFHQHIDARLDTKGLEIQHQLADHRDQVYKQLGVLQDHTDSKLELIGEQLSSITEAVGALTEDMQIVKSDIEFIKGDLKRKVDYDEFQALAKRVTTLEAKARR